MSVQAYTLLGSLIWEWEPFIRLDPEARCLWLALYTTAEAKRVVPGLFVGSITTMAEAAHMPVDMTMRALDRLLEHEMVEFDQKHRLLRLTMLPDGLESPPNSNVLLGWFKRFKGVPACPVRDAHVATLKWIMETWSRESGKPISDKHEQVWNETFGLVQIPIARRRGVRRLLDSDTSTPSQPGLFDPPPVSSLPASDAGSENAITSGGTVPSVIGPTSDEHSLSSSLSSQSIETPIRETVSKPFRNGSDQDQDPDLDLLFRKRETRSGPGLPGDRDRDGPRLTLVPMPPETPPPRTPEQLLSQLAGTCFKPGIRDESVQLALCERVAELETHGVSDADLALCASWIAATGIGSITGDPWSRLSVWAACPGNVLRAISDARAHELRSTEALAELAEVKRKLGYTT